MSTDLVNYDAAFAQQAQDLASVERSGGGNFISVKAGVLQYDKTPFPGNQFICVILDVVTARQYYVGKYDSDAERSLPPTCYAFGRTPQDIAEMEPHPSMMVNLRTPTNPGGFFQPQSAKCASCRLKVYGTADTGRGSACKERRRMALLPAGEVKPRRGSRDFDTGLYTPAQLETMDTYLLNLPGTSIEEYALYLAELQTQHNRGPLAFATRVYTEPHPQHVFHVKFEMVEKYGPEYYEILFKRHEEAKSSIIFGYPPPDQGAVALGYSNTVAR